MAKFDRYTDADNRLIMVLHEWVDIDRQPDGTWKKRPTTIDLVDVYAKKEINDIPVERFHKWIENGLLTFNG